MPQQKIRIHRKKRAPARILLGFAGLLGMSGRVIRNPELNNEIGGFLLPSDRDALRVAQSGVTPVSDCDRGTCLYCFARRNFDPGHLDWWQKVSHALFGGMPDDLAWKGLCERCANRCSEQIMEWYDFALADLPDTNMDIIKQAITIAYNSVDYVLLGLNTHEMMVMAKLQTRKLKNGREIGEFLCNEYTERRPHHRLPFIQPPYVHTWQTVYAGIPAVVNKTNQLWRDEFLKTVYDRMGRGVPEFIIQCEVRLSKEVHRGVEVHPVLMLYFDAPLYLREKSRAKRTWSINRERPLNLRSRHKHMDVILAEINRNILPQLGNRIMAHAKKCGMMGTSTSYTAHIDGTSRVGLLMAFTVRRDVLLNFTWLDSTWPYGVVPSMDVVGQIPWFWSPLDNWVHFYEKDPLYEDHPTRNNTPSPHAAALIDSHPETFF